MSDLIAFENNGVPLVYHAWDQCTLLEEYEMSEKPAHSGGSTTELLRRIPTTVTGRIKMADGLTVPSTDSPVGNVQLGSRDAQRDALRALEGKLVTVTARSLPAEGVTGILRSVKVDDVVESDSTIVVSFEVREATDADFDFDSAEEGFIKVPTGSATNESNDEDTTLSQPPPETDPNGPFSSTDYVTTLQMIGSGFTLNNSFAQDFWRNYEGSAGFPYQLTTSDGIIVQEGGRNMIGTRLYNSKLRKDLCAEGPSFAFNFKPSPAAPTYRAKFTYKKTTYAPSSHFLFALYKLNSSGKEESVVAEGKFFEHDYIATSKFDDGNGNPHAVFFLHHEGSHLDFKMKPEAVRSDSIRLMIITGSLS